MNARPKITLAEARLMSPAELAKLENKALRDVCRNLVPDGKSLKSSERRDANAARAARIAADQSALRRRITTILRDHPRTAPSVGECLGISRHKAASVLALMADDGEVVKYRSDNAPYWRLPSPQPVNAHHCEAITIRGVTYDSSRAAAAALGVTHQAIADAKRRGKLDGVGLRKATGRYQQPTATLTFGAQK